MPRVLGLTLCLSVLDVGCHRARPTIGHDEAVTGSVTYRERIALPTNARLVVHLLDIDAPDVPDCIVASSERAIEHAVPVPFELKYDPHGIVTGIQYGIAAEIRVGDEVWFESAKPSPILTKGHGTHIDLVLMRVPR